MSLGTMLGVYEQKQNLNEFIISFFSVIILNSSISFSDGPMFPNYFTNFHLQLYPYHISDVVVEGLRITPFAYYVEMMLSIIAQEKSYDALPNFTAADCKHHLQNNLILPFYFLFVFIS